MNSRVVLLLALAVSLLLLAGAALGQVNVPPVCDGATVDQDTVLFGSLITGTVTFHDLDLGPQPLVVRLSRINSNGTGPSASYYTDSLGNWWWRTSDRDERDVGTWTLIFWATDGLDTVACNTLTVVVSGGEPLVRFHMGWAEEYTTSDTCVPVTIQNLTGGDTGPCVELGRIELLMTYDDSRISLRGVEIPDSSVLVQAGWEHFTYRVEDSHPPRVRFEALADLDNLNEPLKYCLDGLLFNIRFRTTHEIAHQCSQAPVRFWWQSCSDNAAWSRTGDTVYHITDPNGPVAWYGGRPSAVPPVPGGGIIDGNSYHTMSQIATFDGGVTGPAEFPCSLSGPGDPSPVQYLAFVNGGVKLTCPGDIDLPGDMNLDGLEFEISDFLLYISYFLYGPIVFDVFPEAQIAASDMNMDGVPLTVADLVFLMRIIMEDTEPYGGDLLGGGPKLAADMGTADLSCSRTSDDVTVSLRADSDMGAGLFVFRVDGAAVLDVTPTGLASTMVVKSHHANGELRVLLLPQLHSGKLDRQRIHAGSNEILRIKAKGMGTVQLVHAELATFSGRAVDVKIATRSIPTAYALHQNYPNPFNPSTSMAIDFPNAGDYTLTVYNIAGQTVKTFSGSTEAGTLTITWDGNDNHGSKVASGVYFYRVVTESFTATRRMLFIK